MSSSYYQSASPFPSQCFCGIPVAKRQSWTSLNPGRRFVCCKFSNPNTDFKGCGFFDWVDCDMSDWQRALINQLLLEKKLLEKDKEILKSEVCKLESQKNSLLADLEKIMRKSEKKTKGKRRNENIKFSTCNWVVVMVAAVFNFSKNDSR